VLDCSDSDRAALTMSSGTSTERNLICPRCGAAFVCGSGGHDGQCWCADQPRLLPVPELRAEDCMCPNCLRAALSRQTGAAACAPSR